MLTFKLEILQFKHSISLSDSTSMGMGSKKSDKRLVNITLKKIH